MYIGVIKEKEKGMVNQLDVGNEKDQHNNGSYKKTKRSKLQEVSLYVLNKKTYS